MPCDGRALFRFELLWTIEDVDEVAAVEERDAGEVFEGGGDEVVVVSGAVDRGIGGKTGDDGVFEGAFSHGRRSHGSQGQADGIRESLWFGPNTKDILRGRNSNLRFRSSDFCEKCGRASWRGRVSVWPTRSAKVAPSSWPGGRANGRAALSAAAAGRFCGAWASGARSVRARAGSRSGRCPSVARSG